MNMTGEQRIAASPARVWEALNDPEILRASIPGCQTLAKELDTRFTATVEVKVGPIGARFKGAVNLEDINAPHGYTLIIEGNGGIAGSMKGAAKVRLQPEGDGTLISYDVDAQVGGRMAQLGGPIIDATAKQLAGKFFATFGKVISGETPSEVKATAAGNAAATAGTSALASRPAGDSRWTGIAIGLLLILVAAAAFEFGRHSAQPVIVLDKALLKQLIIETQQETDAQQKTGEQK
ncbi:MAG: carbon monoxide dehydrogenase subunit G [Spongiibacteraceae bacterium]